MWAISGAASTHHAQRAVLGEHRAVAAHARGVAGVESVAAIGDQLLRGAGGERRWRQGGRDGERSERRGGAQQLGATRAACPPGAQHALDRSVPSTVPSTAPSARTSGMLAGSAMPSTCTGLPGPARSCRRGMMRCSSQKRSARSLPSEPPTAKPAGRNCEPKDRLVVGVTAALLCCTPAAGTGPAAAAAAAGCRAPAALHACPPLHPHARTVKGQGGEVVDGALAQLQAEPAVHHAVHGLLAHVAQVRAQAARHPAVRAL